MKKIRIVLGILIIFLISCFTSVNAQKIDTIIQTPIYTSYFCYQTHTPLFVVYKLYKGGGKTSRKLMKFETDGLTQSATEKDYSKSGYDIGHMCNAEDFAFNYSKELITFRFYNALPQTPKSNRGCWKSLEYKTRIKSQKDSLLIICGGFQFNHLINNRVGVPEYTYKIIKDLNTGVVGSYLFPNDNSDSFRVMSLNDLFLRIPYSKDYILKALK